LLKSICEHLSVNEKRQILIIDGRILLILSDESISENVNTFITLNYRGQPNKFFNSLFKAGV
jgi:hypothetical protein